MKNIFVRTMGKKGKSNQHICSNCGYDSRNGDSQKVTTTTDIGEEDIKEAVKIVVEEAMKVFQPLLDKLDQASKQLKEEQVGTPTDGGAQNFEQQLANLQSAAVQRQKLQEQKVAKKMQKIQSRFGT